MVLTARRAHTTRSALRPLSVHLAWNVSPEVHAVAYTPSKTRVPGIASGREIVRERVRARAAGAMFAPGIPSGAVLNREVVSEAGTHSVGAESARPRPATFRALLQKRIETDVLEYRYRRIALTTDLGRILQQRVHERFDRVDNPSIEQPRMVEVVAKRYPAADTTPAQSEAVTTEFDRAARAPRQAEIDLDSVTRHVIHQLDDRLVAYRERMGRI